MPSLFPPYPDPVVEEDRRMRKSWVGFFQIWVAAWDALVASVSSLTVDVTALTTDVTVLLGLERIGPTVNVPYAAGTFTGATGGSVWTVQAADVLTFQTKLVGDWLTVNFFVNATSVSGTPTVILQIAIPYAAAATTVGSAIWASDNGVNVASGVHYTTNTGSARLALARDDGAAWSPSANATSLGGCVSFQVVVP